MLKRAIESVLAQTYTNFRICIYDNASGDETGEVVKDYVSRDSRVEYQLRPVNVGLVNNFVGGIGEVRTPWFVCLSDDDLLLPGFFETALVRLSQHPSAMMFLGATIFAAPDARILDVLTPGSGCEFHTPPNAFLRTLKQRFGWTSALINRQAVRSVGDVGPNVGEFLDFYLMLKVASRYPVMLSDTPCGVFFDGGTQAGLRINSWYNALCTAGESIEADQALAAEWKRTSIAALNELIERSVFNWGVSKMARLGRRDDADAAIDILRRVKARPARLRIVNLIRSRSGFGALARQTFRFGYALRARKRQFAIRRMRKTCEALLRQTLRHLSSRTSAETRASAPRSLSVSMRPGDRQLKIASVDKT